MIFAADYSPNPSTTTKRSCIFPSIYLYAKWLLNKGSFIPKAHKASRKLNSVQKEINTDLTQLHSFQQKGANSKHL